jgi:drug/metabolite transporter (DMT)-like permease
LPRGTSLLATVISSALLGAHFWLWNASLERLPVSTSLILVNIHPVMVFIIEWSRGRVVPSVLALAGLVAALAGTWILAGPVEGEGSGRHLEGMALALGGAAALAGYLLAGRSLRRALPVPTYLITVYGGAALLLAMVICFDPSQQLLPATGWEWLMALLLVIFPTLLGHTPFNAALRLVPATVVSTAFLAEVVGASVLAWIFLHEPLPGGFLLGGGLITAGIIGVTRGTRASRDRD